MSTTGLHKTPEQICLDVFTEVSAIVTHEMRNALAIINEGAGYLDDLAIMYGEDGAIPADKIQRQAASITGQVARANTLMKEVNTYAHSNDVPVSEVRVADLVSLMSALTRRKAAQRAITVDADIPEELGLTTCPIVLLSAIYLCLIPLYQTVEQNSSLSVTAERQGNRVQISFNCGNTQHTLDERLSLLAAASSFELSQSGECLVLTCTDTPLS